MSCHDLRKGAVVHCFIIQKLKLYKMSREIKFRAWSNVRKEFIYNEYLLTDSVKGIMKIAGVTFSQQESDLDDDVEIMQYTGLKDKNGKEIYEGDIVQMPQSYIKPITVYWNKEMTGFYPLLSERGHNIKIIGNIYENPELLNTPVK